MYLMDYTVSTPEVTVVISDIQSIDDDYYTGCLDVRYSGFLDVYYNCGYRHTGYVDFFFDDEENDLGVSWGLYEDAIYDEDDNQYDSLPEHLKSIDITPLISKNIDKILPELKEFHNALS